jgi:hypothetical protein
MATSTTSRVPVRTTPAPLTARDRALALRRRLLPLAAAWALLVTLPLYWIVVGEIADSVTAHGTRRFAAPAGPLLAGLFLLVLLAPCVASAGLSLLAWHRSWQEWSHQSPLTRPDVGHRRAHLLLPGGLAGGVIGWCADQVERTPVLTATAVLVAAMFGGAALVVLRRRELTSRE